MADFTTSYLGGPSGSPVSPQTPVVDESSLVTLDFLGDAAAALGGVATNYAEIKREQQKAELAAQIQAQQDQAISNFSRDQLKLVDAVDMGDLSSSEARMRMRANLSRYIADNPALAADLGKAHTSVIKSTGLGDVVYEGTQAEQQQLMVENEAVKAGWIRPDMAEIDKAAGTEAYLNFKRSLDLLEGQTKKLALQKAQVTLTTAGISQQTAKLKLSEQQNKVQSQAAVAQASSAYTVKLSNDMEQIKGRLDRNEITREQALMEADQNFFQVSNVLSQVGDRAGSEYLNNIGKPLQMQYENYRKYFSGELTKEALDNDNSIAIGLQTKNALGDPQIAKVAAVSKILPNANLVTLDTVNNRVVNFLDRGSNGETKPNDVLPDVPEDKAALEGYFGLMSDAMSKVNNKTARDIEETRVEINTNLNDILRGVDVYSPTAANTSDYKSVIDFIAKPEVGKFVTSQGGFQDNQAAFRAAEALQFQYDTVLIPLVQEAYQRSKTSGEAVVSYYGRTEVPGIKGQKSTKDVIKPQFIGSGVTFVADPGVTDSFTRRKVKELNETVAPILNKMIRTQAHLSGNMDYKSVYQSQYEQKVFGVGEETDANQE